MIEDEHCLSGGGNERYDLSAARGTSVDSLRFNEVLRLVEKLEQSTPMDPLVAMTVKSVTQYQAKAVGRRLKPTMA